MAPVQTKERAAFIVVTVVGVGIGLYGALITPAAYGLTLARANALMDVRPWGWTIGWVLFAVVVLVIALWRASILRRQGRPPRPTMIRGVLWLWGSVAGSWFLVWAAWDMQMADVLRLEAIEGNRWITGIYALSGIVALLLAPVWSVISRFRSSRSASAVTP